MPPHFWCSVFENGGLAQRAWHGARKWYDFEPQFGLLTLPKMFWGWLCGGVLIHFVMQKSRHHFNRVHMALPISLHLWRLDLRAIGCIGSIMKSTSCGTTTSFTTAAKSLILFVRLRQSIQPLFVCLPFFCCQRGSTAPSHWHCGPFTFVRAVLVSHTNTLGAWHFENYRYAIAPPRASCHQQRVSRQKLRSIFYLWDKWFGTYQEELDSVPLFMALHGRCAPESHQNKLHAHVVVDERCLACTKLIDKLKVVHAAGLATKMLLLNIRFTNPGMFIL